MSYPYYPPVEGKIPIVAELPIPESLYTLIDPDNKKETEVVTIFEKLIECGINTALLGGAHRQLQCVLEDVLKERNIMFPFLLSK